MSMRMPVLFIGHGSPMNALEDNEFSRGWRSVAELIPKPTAILCASAHWYVGESLLLATERPRTIHDFWGFPDELYRVRYDAPGAPDLAAATAALIHSAPVSLDQSWGLDHGVWTVLANMFPAADIPVSQLSIDYNLDSAGHFAIGRELRALRDQGVLIIGSGNLVHNLGNLDWFHADRGFDWAEDFNRKARDLILAKEFEALIDYEGLDRSAALAVPTPDHYWPLLYALGAAEPSETVFVFNDRCVLGSVSMISLLFGAAGS